MTDVNPDESDYDNTLRILIQGVPHISTARTLFNQWCFENGFDPNSVLRRTTGGGTPSTGD